MAPLNIPPPAGLLNSLFEVAVSSAQPSLVLAQHLPPPPLGRTVVVGVGKAAAAMAQTVEQHWPGPLSGVVVVPQGAELALKQIQTLVGSHPVPNEDSVRGGAALLQAVKGLGADDLVIALVSGGGSALCAMPAHGLSLEQKQHITRALLLGGASIAEINTVRRHLSSIKAIHRS
jgi:hydroxypyruvate reductase